MRREGEGGGGGGGVQDPKIMLTAIVNGPLKIRTGAMVGETTPAGQWCK